MFITVIVTCMCIYLYMHIMASSGHTLGMVMRVLCAEGPRDAINHSVNDDCELR